MYLPCNFKLCARHCVIMSTRHFVSPPERNCQEVCIIIPFTDRESSRICVTYSRSHIWSVSGLTPYCVSVHDPIPAFRNEQIKNQQIKMCNIWGMDRHHMPMVNTFAMLGWQLHVPMSTDFLLVEAHIVDYNDRICVGWMIQWVKMQLEIYPSPAIRQTVQI